MRSRAETSPPTPRTPRTERSSASPNPLEYPEEDDAGYTVSETWSNIAVPTWDRLQPPGAKVSRHYQHQSWSAADALQVWQMKLPQYMEIDPRPYDTELYRASLNPADEVDGAADPVAAQRKMIGVKNTMRWRWSNDSDGKPVSTVRSGW